MKKSFVLWTSVLLAVIAFGCEPPNTPNNGCDAPDNDCKQMETVNWKGTGNPPSGPYEVVLEQDPDFNTHTIYRPVGVTGKMPIVSWGNGGCTKDGTSFAEFLTELASHGFLVISDGAPGGGGDSEGTMQNPVGTALIDAIDWAIDQNGRSCSPLYQKVNTSKIAVMGQSCGGLMTYRAAGDPRVSTIVIWNSGLFQRNQELYNSIHSPMAFFIGGERDIAYENAKADFSALKALPGDFPIFYGNLDVGHIATYWQDNGGEFGRVGVAWLKYQLLDDQGPEGAQMFEGPNCGLCNTEWVIEKKNMP